MQHPAIGHDDAKSAVTFREIRTRFQGNDKPGTSRAPLEILDERYARGEVGREEYLSRRADLERKDAT